MAEKSKLWYLQNFNLFKEIDDHTVIDMADESHMIYSKKKAVIYFPEESSKTIYLLKQGKIKISRISPEGETVTLALLGPGEIFGESALLGQVTHENIAETVDDAIICAISKEQFTELLEKNDLLSRRIFTYIGDRKREVESRFEDLFFKDARERVVAFLRRYVETFGTRLVDLWEVRPFLSQQDIAELSATSRQAVNSILNDLRQEGQVDFTRQYLRIKNPQELA